MKKLKLFLLIVIMLSLPVNGYCLTEKYCDCGDGGEGDGSAGDPWATLQEAFDEVSAGERINILSTTACQPAGSSGGFDIDTTVGSGANLIYVQGYTSSAGDGGIATIDANGETNCMQVDVGGYVFKDLIFTGSTGDAITTNVTSSDYCWFENIEITDAGGDGISEGDYWYVYGSEISVTGSALTVSSGYFYKNYIHDCGNDGIHTSFTPTVSVGNIIDTVTDNGIEADYDFQFMVGNTIYNSGGDNIYIISAEYSNTIIDNILNTATEENLDIDGNVAFYGYNNLNTNGGTAKSGTININLGGEETGIPDFEDASSGDFNLDTSTTLDNTAYPIAGGLTAQTDEQGAVPYEETGGAGGGTYGGSFTNF